MNFYHCAIENVLIYGLLCGSPAALSKQACIPEGGEDSGGNNQDDPPGDQHRLYHPLPAENA